MAQIHKISGYVVDIEEIFGKDVLEAFFSKHDFATQQLHVETADIGKWDDKHPLNYRNCDLAECEKWFLKEPTIGLSTRKVEPGAIYKHFKGKEVKVLAISRDTENVAGCSVVYENMDDGIIWHRPYDMFISEVDHEKFPEVKQKYRFEKVRNSSMRNLCGVYFPVERNGKHEAICFSDLTQNEMKMVLEGKSEEYLKNLCYRLGEVIQEIGDAFDIERGADDDE